MTNADILILFRESGEASFMVFLEKYIEWIDLDDCFTDGGVVWLRDQEWT